MIQEAARLDGQRQHGGWKVEMGLWGVRRERSRVDVLFVCLFVFLRKSFLYLLI
jgi:hypothetical protein